MICIYLYIKVPSIHASTFAYLRLGRGDVPRPAEKYKNSISWFCFEAFYRWTCLKHLPREATWRHCNQMPKPPQLSLKVKKQRHCQTTALLTLKENPVTLLRKQISASCICVLVQTFTACSL